VFSDLSIVGVGRPGLPAAGRAARSQTPPPGRRPPGDRLSIARRKRPRRETPNPGKPPVGTPFEPIPQPSPDTQTPVPRAPADPVPGHAPTSPHASTIYLDIGPCGMRREKTERVHAHDPGKHPGSWTGITRVCRLPPPGQGVRPTPLAADPSSPFRLPRPKQSASGVIPLGLPARAKQPPFGRSFFRDGTIVLYPAPMPAGKVAVTGRQKHTRRLDRLSIHLQAGRLVEKGMSIGRALSLSPAADRAMIDMQTAQVIGRLWCPARRRG